MKEINRLQQLAGIITEIKVNNPLLNITTRIDITYEDDEGEWIDDDLVKDYLILKFKNENNNIDSYLEDLQEADVDLYKDITLGELFEDYENWKVGNGLDEGVDDFHIGQTSNNNGIKTTVKDVDTTTQSVTWDVKKEVTDADIHKKMTQLIADFEKVKLKDFHSRPKLIQLVKDLKTIRNKFSRTIQK